MMVLRLPEYCAVAEGCGLEWPGWWCMSVQSSHHTQPHVLVIVPARGPMSARAVICWGTEDVSRTSNVKPIVRSLFGLCQ